MNDKKMWQKLYDEALSVQNPRLVSNFIEAGGVAAAILTDKGNIYNFCHIFLSFIFTPLYLILHIFYLLYLYHLQ